MEYADILRLIESAQGETDLLEYKRGDALGRQNDQRDGLMKEVLGFANSGGGTLIYGVATFAERARKHLPERLAPVTDATVTVEWIQQMINSNSAPRFSDVQIQQIECPDQAGRIFVLEIGRALTAHQCPDGLYYQRAGLETLRMSDSQIRDVMSRRTGMRVDVQFRRIVRRLDAEEHRYDLVPRLQNAGNLTAQRWRFRIDIPRQAVDDDTLSRSAALHARSPVQRTVVVLQGRQFLRITYPYLMFSALGLDDLHPGDELEISENAGVAFPVPIRVNGDNYREIAGLPVLWRFSAADSSPIDQEVSFQEWCSF